MDRNPPPAAPATLTGRRGGQTRAGWEDGMKPHLSAEELGFLLGRLPLETLPGAVWRDPAALEDQATRQAAPAPRAPGWNGVIPGCSKPARGDR